MKKLFFSTLLFFCFIFSNAGVSADQEIAVLRVEYSKKKDGVHSQLKLEIGLSNTHSLYHNFQSDEGGSVTYKDADGKMKVFTNEIDLMNFLFTLGYSFKEVYTVSIMSETFYNFVLVKE